MQKKTYLWVILFVVLLTSALAQSAPYHLKLLAVQETEHGYLGSAADLYLEIKEGSGRVFLDTFPLTKMDTQISTRFAKEIACTHFRLDCSQYDFIYTIKAQSNIIGGPSAGAAVAALTAMALLDVDYDETITITGTVNSGGIIGPVGGIKEKLDVAASSGLKKVLLAKGAYTAENRTGTESLHIVDYGKKVLGIEVVEVVSLDDVIEEFTGLQLDGQESAIQENPQYQEIMKRLQQQLCERTEKITQEIGQRGIPLSLNVTDSIRKRTEQAYNATLAGDYYSAASFCFGANIQLKMHYYQREEVSAGQLEQLFRSLQERTTQLQRRLEQEQIATISDVQTLLIVKERLNDVQEQIQQYREEKEDTPQEERASLLAYGEERLFSAASWMEFFTMGGRTVEVTPQRLQDACLHKISEAEERHQYVSLFISEFYIPHIQEKIGQASTAQHNGDVELCLITAAQAKADADAILGTLGLEQQALDSFIESKRKAVERVIAENSAEGKFPILGYSYYQYALSLQHDDPATALLYLEYALEMSDLGTYFPEEERELKASSSTLPSLGEKWRFAAGGLIVGLIMGILVFYLYRRNASVQSFVGRR